MQQPGSDAKRPFPAEQRPLVATWRWHAAGGKPISWLIVFSCSPRKRNEQLRVLLQHWRLSRSLAVKCHEGTTLRSRCWCWRDLWRSVTHRWAEEQSTNLQVSLSVRTPFQKCYIDLICASITWVFLIVFCSYLASPSKSIRLLVLISGSSFINWPGRSQIIEPDETLKPAFNCPFSLGGCET